MFHSNLVGAPTYIEKPGIDSYLFALNFPANTQKDELTHRCSCQCRASELHILLLCLFLTN